MNAKNSKRRSGTDWRRVRGLKDRDIDYSDIPELDEGFFNQAVLWPGAKKQITLRLDPDVLRFFRKQGKGYQSNINAILRRYMKAQKRQAS